MYSGLTGKLSFAEKNAGGGFESEKVIGYISNWSVEDSRDIVEFSTLGGGETAPGFKQKRPGLQSWTASADGVVCFETGKNQKTLFDAKKSRAELKFKFYLNGSDYFEGRGFIESLSVDLSSEDKGNVSISIAGNGRLNLYVNNSLQY